MTDETRVVDVQQRIGEFLRHTRVNDEQEIVQMPTAALNDFIDYVRSLAGSVSNVARPRGTITWCPTGCGGSINTAVSNACDKCGADLTVTEIPYDHPERCDLRTKGPDSWGCHKRKGHATGNGGRHCSTHTDCGYCLPGGGICGKPPGHDGNVHEIADDAPVVSRQEPLDSYHWHEALDRCYVFASAFEDHVGNHQVVERDPELTKLAEDAGLAMHRLYQAIGQKDHERRESDVTPKRQIPAVADLALVTLLNDAAHALERATPGSVLVGALSRAANNLREALKVDDAPKVSCPKCGQQAGDGPCWQCQCASITSTPPEEHKHG